MLNAQLQQLSLSAQLSVAPSVTVNSALRMLNAQLQQLSLSALQLSAAHSDDSKERHRA